MTAGGLWGYFTESLRSFFAARFGVKCSKCKIPAVRSNCPGCGSTITLAQVLEAAVSPFRERIRKLLVPSDTTKRYLPWAYLLGSAIVFWVTFGVLEQRFSDGWVLHAILSVVYLAVFLLIARWVIPRKIFYNLAYKTVKPVKLGIVFNYLTSLFLLQMYLTTWWTRSLMLAGLFIASWVGIRLFCLLLWPDFNELGEIFMPPSTVSDKAHDPRTAQGRKVETD